MKKIVTLVVVLLLLLVAAPWGIGRLAEKRVNAGLDQLVQEAPYLTIVERHWTTGWFRSEQQVTFEVFGAWLGAMNPATVPGETWAASEADVEAQDLAARKLSPVPGAAAAPDQAPVESPQATPAPAPAAPIRFTVRNEILHGPVLWPFSLGVARVNTRLVLNDELRHQLVKFFGTDEPVRISSRVGFFGGGSTRLLADGRTVELKEKGGLLSYDDLEFEVDYSGDFDEADMEGSWSRFEYTDTVRGERLVASGMSLEGDSERIVGDLYDTDLEFEIDEMLFVGADKMETTVDEVHYGFETSHQDGFVDVAAKFGSGRISNPALTDLKLDLKEIHYDFTMRRLHAETLQKLVAELKAMYSRPVTTMAEMNSAVLTPMKQHGLALLKHNPEFLIDRMGVVTSDGQGVLKGVLRLPGVTEAEFAAGAKALVGRLEADFTMEVAQKLLEKIPNGATGAGLAVDQGFARRDGDQLVSHIEFKQGELTVNGKPVPIPGLGAPPQEPPPQE